MEKNFSETYMKNIKVLIVEDNAIVRKSVKRMLVNSTLSTEIYEAENSAEAILMLNDEKPFVTILDLNLNGENGINLIHEIKNNHNSKVIVLTNESSPAIRKKCIKVGADYFLDKSLEFDKVFPSISNLVESAN